jgi:hypothetical protein
LSSFLLVFVLLLQRLFTMHAIVVIALKYIIMKVISLLKSFVAALILVFVVSCSSTPESKLIGTWKVTDVQVDFDEQKTDPGTVNQVAEREKKTILKFTSDSTLTIIDNNNTHKALWKLAEDGKVTYSFEGDQLNNDLGIYEEGKITITSDTPLGEIITVFEKSK